MSRQEVVRSYCRLCPALCGILVEVEDGRPIRVSGDPDHPISAGYTCPKGRSLLQLHEAPDRLDGAWIGRPPRRREVPWDEAIHDLGSRLRQVIAEHGPDAVGVYLGTGASLDRGARWSGKRFLRSLGSRSLYTSASVDAPGKALVAEMVGGSPALFPHVDPSAALTILVGTNPVVSHGHLDVLPNPRGRLREMAQGGELWVVDPRRTETARLADHHLAPRPGTDHVWLAAVVREVLGRADLDLLRSRTTGLDDLVHAVEGYTLDIATQTCGLEPGRLDALVASIGRAGRIAGVTGTGVSMSVGGNVAEWLLWALLIVTDSLDRPGGVWFNPGQLSRHDLADVDVHRSFCGPGPKSRPELLSRFGELPSTALVDEIRTGELRALLVLGGNPMAALPGTHGVAQAMESLEVLAVADIVPTGTTDRATHVFASPDALERADLPVFDSLLPAMVAQYTTQVVPPAAGRRPVWWAVDQVAQQLGFTLADEPLTSDDDVLRLAVRDQGLWDELVSTERPVGTIEAVVGWVTRRLADHGGWRIAPASLVAELGQLAVPEGVTLVPRRQLRHTNSLLADRGTADGRLDDAEVLIHPRDAESAGVEDGDTVSLVSDVGRVLARAVVTDTIRPGAVSLPHGHEGVNVNLLTDHRNVNLLSAMPLLSGVVIRLEAADTNG